MHIYRPYHMKTKFKHNTVNIIYVILLQEKAKTKIYYSPAFYNVVPIYFIF